MISHVDDFLTLYKNNKVLKDLIRSLEDDFRFIDKGDLETCIGVNFNQKNHDTLETNQPHLIELILELLKLNEMLKCMMLRKIAYFIKIKMVKEEFENRIIVFLLV